MLPSATMDKSKDWQLELLMEKLRSKASQFKNFTETSKSVRMAMLVGRNLLTDNLRLTFMLFVGQAIRFGQCRKEPTPEMSRHTPAIY